MSGSKGKGFSVVSVGNSISVLVILAFLVLHRVCFLEEATFSSLSVRPSTNALNMFSATLPAATGDGRK